MRFPTPYYSENFSPGVAGDLWCWIRDYLSGRTQVTTINGCQSQAMPVTFGVPRGSV